MTRAHTIQPGNMYINAINRRHAFAGCVRNSRSDRSSSRSVTNADAHSDAWSASRCRLHSYFTKFAGASSTSFFPSETRAPEEWKSSLCGMSSWYCRAAYSDDSRFRGKGENRRMVAHWLLPPPPHWAVKRFLLKQWEMWMQFAAWLNHFDGTYCTVTRSISEYVTASL